MRRPPLNILSTTLPTPWDLVYAENLAKIRTAGHLMHAQVAERLRVGQ